MSGRPYAEVIGDPIAHSKSPLIHNFWLNKLGIDAEYRAHQVGSEELEGYFLRRLEDREWRGCNVTMPHKEAVGRLIHKDRMDTLGVTNTVTSYGGRLTAWNTDIAGVHAAICSHYDDLKFGTKAAKVQIVGAGGASRAAIKAVMDSELWLVELFGRSPDRAREAAVSCGLSRRAAFSLDELSPWPGGEKTELFGHDFKFLIINASPMGMVGKPPVPIDLGVYPRDTIVFDMVYAPLETPLLRNARDLGMVTIDGLEMLVAQAAVAFELFFGQAAPREHDAELRALLAA